MSAWSPLQYRVYRTLWIALLASNIGTWMQAVGAAWMMVELDASPTVVALVQTATYLPVVVVGVLAGAAADLVERRRLLLITQGFMLAAAGALAVLSALDAVTPGLLLTLHLRAGAGSGVQLPRLAGDPAGAGARARAQAGGHPGRRQHQSRAAPSARPSAVCSSPRRGRGWCSRSTPPRSPSCSSCSGAGSARSRRTSDRRSASPGRSGPASATPCSRTSCTASWCARSRSAWPAPASCRCCPCTRARSSGWGSGGLGILFGAMGAGAVVTAAVIPSVRERLSADRVFAAGSVPGGGGAGRAGARAGAGARRRRVLRGRRRLAVLPLDAQRRLPGSAARAGCAPAGSRST